ncbi:hypothetical protein A3I56_00820 [Candidatus Roizmanbacteria bacterium RIFCSPLOWO2_02_FULL_43_10]|uniref:Uncharacterized protein n=2 Tax=Candidatus Roizmaniibacteriota TaxID=1752723 RepID=A0A1F7K135_9BACT|nr:MAG: hypothetical protein A3D08_02215 [Candidatus Roizmanbacteria bacterium RIFCSPHIGHO2_02_FULL_43_11]OGK61559.1 MAG: hypothetical protein A3I56_00820 [Candidatus Roizmanbacteria bacterium RIFCSPLOWO2_02_FULL_43_10]
MAITSSRGRKNRKLSLKTLTLIVAITAAILVFYAGQKLSDRSSISNSSFAQGLTGAQPANFRRECKLAESSYKCIKFKRTIADFSGTQRRCTNFGPFETSCYIGMTFDRQYFIDRECNAEWIHNMYPAPYLPLQDSRVIAEIEDALRARYGNGFACRTEDDFLLPDQNGNPTVELGCLGYEKNCPNFIEGLQDYFDTFCDDILRNCH